MKDEEIINLYKKGYSVKYISKIYYKFINRERKPITLDGVVLYPTEILNLFQCSNYVSSVIYSYILNKDIFV